jgi:hypothetical protein
VRRRSLGFDHPPPGRVKRALHAAGVDAPRRRRPRWNLRGPRGRLAPSGEGQQA